MFITATEKKKTNVVPNCFSLQKAQKPSIGKKHVNLTVFGLEVSFGMITIIVLHQLTPLSNS